MFTSLMDGVAPGTIGALSTERRVGKPTARSRRHRRRNERSRRHLIAA